MATGLTFPTLNPCISPYGLVVILNDFFLQIQTASTFNFDTFVTGGAYDGTQLTLTNNAGGSFSIPWQTDVTITGGSYSLGTSEVILENNTGGTVVFSLSAITDQIDNIIVNAGNDFVTAGTFDLNSREITFTRQSGGTFTTDLSAITDEIYSLSSLTSFDVTTGATYDPATSSLNFSTYTGGSYSVDVGALTADTYVTAATIGTIFGNNNSLILTRNDGQKISTSLSAFTANEFVNSGTYTLGTNTLQLVTNSGNTVDIDMSDLAGQINTDDYVVSGVFNSGTSVMTLTTLSGNTVEITGVTQEDRYIFSGQVVGNSVINFFGTNGYNFSVDVTSLSSSAMAIAGGSYSGESSSLVFNASSGGTAFVIEGITRITGGTYDTGIEQLILHDSTGGTVSIGGFLDNYVTGATFDDSNYNLSLTDRSGNTISVHLGALTADTGVLAVQGGTNISTGGTQQIPIINLDDNIVVTSVAAGTGNITTLNATNVNATNGVFTNIDSINGDFVNLDAAIILSAGTNLYDIFGTGSGGGASGWDSSLIIDNVATSRSPVVSGITMQFHNNSGSRISYLYTDNSGFHITGDTGYDFNTNSKAAVFNGASPWEDRFIQMGVDAGGEPSIQARNGTAIGQLSFTSVTSTRVWFLPDKSGTIALLSDLTGATGGSSTWQDVVSNGNTVTTGSPTIDGTPLFIQDSGVPFRIEVIAGSLSLSGASGRLKIGASTEARNNNFTNRFVSFGVDSGGSPRIQGRNEVASGFLHFSAITDERYWDLPDQSGTIALLNDITGLTPTAPQVLTYSATTWLNVDGGFNAELTLTGDADLEIQNMSAGEYATWVIKQDGVGSHSITSLPTGSIVVNGQNGAITVTGNPNAIDMFTIYYDGTNYFWNNGFNYT